ncbi:MAG: radical SAM family heme chaperone HemW [Balneolaceae bacterium]|nr:MAG: radical SAM family heme chaperone HemW [Balneolaceae bacterium]
MAGLYIHIPFCKQACSYCDFYFSTRQQLRTPFLETLVKEIRSYQDTELSEIVWQTLYLGGGTPSLLSERELTLIFDAVHDVFRTDFREVTMELNPDDVTAEYLNTIRDAGVNRASMGVQSFQPELLRFMHRAHTAEEAFTALQTLRETGFPSYTADLIYGNPQQDLKMLEKDISEMLRFAPPHISAYSLTIEPGTRLGKQLELGRLSPADDEIVARHHSLLRALLGDAGLSQYEVSNYAIPGKEALHNSNYWRHEPYLGFGPSAHSFIPHQNHAKRWKNRSDLKAYLSSEQGAFQEEAETLDLHTLAEERLMLGMRTREGVSLSELSSAYDYHLAEEQFEWIREQKRKRMIESDPDRITCTADGLLIADYLIVELLSRHSGEKKRGSG